MEVVEKKSKEERLSARQEMIDQLRDLAMKCGAVVMLPGQKPRQPWQDAVEQKKLFVFHWDWRKESDPDKIAASLQWASEKAGLRPTALGDLYASMLGDGKWQGGNGLTLVVDKKNCVGVAKCSRNDTFSRRRGLPIAYGRLIKNPIVII